MWTGRSLRLVSKRHLSAQSSLLSVGAHARCSRLVVGKLSGLSSSPLPLLFLSLPADGDTAPTGEFDRRPPHLSAQLAARKTAAKPAEVTSEHGLICCCFFNIALSLP